MRRSARKELGRAGRKGLGRAGQEAQQAMDAALAAQAKGRNAEALTLLRKSLEASQALIAAEPGNQAYRQGRASTFYSLGAVLNALDRPGEALEALDQAEQLYLELGREHAVDARPLVADVQIRRATSMGRLGRGVSAVLEADAAVTSWINLRGGQVPGSDVARVLTRAASVQAQYGDPDLAVGAADTAVRGYLRMGQLPGNKLALAPVDLNNMFEAASVAALVHLECDRADVGLEALMMADFAGQGLGVASQRQLIMNAATEPDKRGPRHLAALALARQFVGRVWHRELPDVPDALARTSLADALDRSGQDVDGVLREVLTEPVLECTVLIPRMRVDPQAMPPLAERLAQITLETIEDQPIPAARIGLEAHCLYAIASREQTPTMRYGLAEFGATWGRLLLALSRFMADRHDDALALDLARWGAGLAQQLPPLPGGTATVVRDLYARYGDLAAAAGDAAAAESARAAAAAAAQFSTD